MASTKRKNPATEEQPHPKRQNASSHETDSSHSFPRPVLNPADCDLAFNVEADGLTGHALCEEGFAYCWSGARGNIGITGGKYCFGCKIISDQSVKMDTPLDQQHISRVGISRGNDPVGSLGETKHSFGYGGSSKISNAGRFVDYGERFGIGDTIICFVDLESKPWALLEFSKNGKRLGVAKHFDTCANVPSAVKLPWASAFFPHVLLKNTVVKMQFSIEDGLVPEEGYKPWDSAVKDGKAVIGPDFSDPKDCEVIMMVGLPASGKTTWAENWVKEHPEKRYITLGTNLALDQMKVSGIKRKNNYGERFDCLMDRATGMFNKLMSRASKVSRNYIIDQTNVYKSARIRKLKPFYHFHKIAVVVFPCQNELKARAEKRFKEMGKEVPSEAVNEMLVNFVLPKSKDMDGTNEYFDEVIFTDLSRGELQQHLDEMKRGLQLSSMEKSKSDHPPCSHESSVYSNSRVSASSLPASGSPYLGYPSPSIEIQTGTVGSRIGRPEPPLQPNTASMDWKLTSLFIQINKGYTGVGQHGTLSMEHQCPYIIDNRTDGPRYSGISEPAAGPNSYRGSLNPMLPRDPDSGYNSAQYGIPGYGNYAEDARSVHYQLPYVSPYGTPNTRPHGSYPAGLRYPGNVPYPPPPRYW